MTTSYIRDNDLYFKEEENRALVLKKDKKSIVELNEIGLLIWKLLKTKKTVDSIVKRILEEYKNTDNDDIKRDVEEFLNQCIKDSMVKKID